MRIGLLQCDAVREDLRHLRGDYPEMFRRRLTPWIEMGLVDLHVYNLLEGAYPDSPSDCGAWLTTGSRFGVHDPEPWIAWLMDFVRRLAAGGDSRLAGICFGHQIIAQALGGAVETSNRGWGIGISNCQVSHPQPWMQPSATDFNILVSHQDQVVSLPAGAQTIAGNSFCPNHALILGDRIIGIQGHPEYDSDYAIALAETRPHLIPAETLQKARESVAIPPDNTRTFQWIMNFLGVPTPA